MTILVDMLLCTAEVGDYGITSSHRSIVDISSLVLLTHDHLFIAAAHACPLFHVRSHFSSFLPPLLVSLSPLSRNTHTHTHTYIHTHTHTNYTTTLFTLTFTVPLILSGSLSLLPHGMFSHHSSCIVEHPWPLSLACQS